MHFYYDFIKAKTQFFKINGCHGTRTNSTPVKTKSSGPRNVLVLVSRDVPKVGITKNDKKQRPAIINAYNFTNNGTDVMDQRMVNYSTSSKSKWFSRKVVDYLLDTAIRNAQTIYNLNANQNPRK